MDEPRKPRIINRLLKSWKSDNLPNKYIIGVVTMKYVAPIMPISAMLAPILLANTGTKM